MGQVVNMEKRPEAGSSRPREKSPAACVQPVHERGKERDRGRDETGIGHKPSLRRLSNVERDPLLLTGGVSAWEVERSGASVELGFPVPTAHEPHGGPSRLSATTTDQSETPAGSTSRRQGAQPLRPLSPRHVRVPQRPGMWNAVKAIMIFHLHARVCRFRVFWDRSSGLDLERATVRRPADLVVSVQTVLPR